MGEMNQVCLDDGFLRQNGNEANSIYLRQVKYGMIGDDNRIIPAVKRKKDKVDVKRMILYVLSVVLGINIVLIILTFI